MSDDRHSRYSSSGDSSHSWLSHRTHTIGGRMAGKPDSPQLTALTYSHNGKNDNKVLYAVPEVYLRSRWRCERMEAYLQ